MARGALPRTHAEFPPGLAAGTGGRVGAVVLDPTVAPRPRPGLAAGGHRFPGLQPRGRVGPGRGGRAPPPALPSRPDRPRLGGRCAAAPRRRTTPRRGPGRDSRLPPESGSAGPTHRGHHGHDLGRGGRRTAVAGGRRVRALARGEPAGPRRRGPARQRDGRPDRRRPVGATGRTGRGPAWSLRAHPAAAGPSLRRPPTGSDDPPPPTAGSGRAATT